MKTKIENIQNKFVILVEKPDKVVGKNKFDVIYAIDDEDVLWIHQKRGGSRGTRFACISEKTFFNTREQAQKGIDYLKTCHFSFLSINDSCVCIIPVHELKYFCTFTYDILMEDVNSNNEDVNYETNRNEEAERQEKLRAALLMQKFREGEILDFESDHEDDVYIVTIKIKKDN